MQEKLLTHSLQHTSTKADGTFEGAVEGRVTGVILRFYSKHRWLRALGLHFINTPSNLIRFNFQHFPVLW